jgi:hypothetical protein
MELKSIVHAFKGSSIQRLAPLFFTGFESGKLTKFGFPAFDQF